MVDNNYLKQYNIFIKRLKRKTLKGFHEKHHILPRCMGGSDDPSNIVKLSSEDHYWAHYLLAKAYPENSKLRYAFYMMCTQKQTYRPEASRKLKSAAKKMMGKINTKKLGK